MEDCRTVIQVAHDKCLVGKLLQCSQWWTVIPIEYFCMLAERARECQGILPAGPGSRCRKGI
eukprot:scaffold385926_cov31-Prasinocladus_malaysianus.AAC.1